MSDPRFLTEEQVSRLHDQLIERFGGTLGLRDSVSFQSAVMHPQNVYFYAQGDVFDIAAAYAYHLAESQAFLDGNKRTAVTSALTFLDGNGVEVSASDKDLYEMMIAIANKQADKEELAELLRKESNANG